YNYYAYINIRGANAVWGGTAKILVDGQEVADPNYIVGLDPGLIDRVEVLRGPQASTIYGSAASGGVIQFFTKKGFSSLTPQVETKITGSYLQSPRANTGKTDDLLTLTGGSKDWSYRISGGYVNQGEWYDQAFQKDGSVGGTIRGNQGPIE